MATRISAPAIDPATEADRFAVVLAAATVALIPVARGWVLWSAPGGAGDLNQQVSTSPFDWPLFLLVAVAGYSAARTGSDSPRERWRSASLATRMLVLLGCWAALSLLVHPSWRGAMVAFHVAGAWALVRTVRRATRAEQTVLLVALTVVGVVEAVLGAAQSLAGENVGIDLLELPGELYTFGSASAGTGSFAHPYHLTAFLVTAAAGTAVLAGRLVLPARRWALAALAVIGLAIPLTFSRAVVLAVVPMVLLWLRRAGTRPIAAAFGIGLAVGALLGVDGLLARADQSVDAQSVDSGRRDRLAEAWRLVEHEPVLGVGPGNYVIELGGVEHDERLPAHNVVAQAAAETGIPGGTFALATVVSFAAWLARRALTVVAAGISLLPFHLLDAYPHVFALGITITGLWLAIVAVARTDAGSPP